MTLDNFETVILNADKPKGIYNGYHYKCFDRNGNRSFNMQIKYNDISRILTISGSLRKWMFGKAYLKEFTSVQHFYEALRLFCEIHEIPVDKVWNGKLKFYEIGFSFKTPFKLSDIGEDIRSTDIAYHCHYSNETICFENSHYRFTIYDKNLENETKKSAVRNAKAANTLMRTNNNFNRCELRIKGKLTLDDMEISTLYDVAQTWDSLIAKLGGFISTLTLRNNFRPPVIEGLTANEITQYALGFFINCMGADKFDMMVRKSIISDSNRPKVKVRFRQGLIYFDSLFEYDNKEKFIILKDSALNKLESLQVA